MSSKIKVTCIKCKKLLAVPAKAAGHKVRCPACTHVFPVPEPKKDKVHSDDSIAGWIYQDVDDEMSEKIEGVERKIEQFKPNTVVDNKADRARNTQKQLASMLGGDADETESARQAVEPGSDAVSQPAAPVATAPPPPEAAPQPPIPAAPDPVPVPAPAPVFQPQPSPARAPMTYSPAAAGPNVPSERTGATVQTTHGYPGNIHVTEPIPHLVIREVTHHGVKIAFDAAWLDHIAFRCSLPMRCAITGNPDRSELFVRPLLFIDRSGAQIRTASDIRSGYGQRLLDNVTPRELLSVIPPITQLPSPFSNPTPYYVCSSAADQDLQCTSKNRPDGGITCEVLIPDGRYALDWLARVNGICGPEYEMLESDIKQLLSDGYGVLPAKTRERLEAWVQFMPRERFKIYVNDAEFGQKDAGLAGIVITDRRLLYRKYHRNGEVYLDAEGLLLIGAEADFASVTLQTSEGKARIASLRLDDVPRLIHAVGQNRNLRVESGIAAR